MSITRTARIFIALYFQFLDRGFTEKQAKEICVAINSDIICTHKDDVIYTLADDIKLAHKEIVAKCSEDMAMDLLIKSIKCHYEEKQPIY
jgi:hypothetical protein